MLVCILLLSSFFFLFLFFEKLPPFILVKRVYASFCPPFLYVHYSQVNESYNYNSREGEQRPYHDESHLCREHRHS